ncbi:hypothetical protein [Nocardia salmonicida]|uniref:hypothetical protein n=1 Tax=Nocardia salmonicida TaxID=53431 RepID=UPI003643B4F1
MSYVHIRQCHSFAQAVASVGGKMPAELSDILAAADVVKEWRPASTTGIAAQIRSGEFTAAKAATLLEQAHTAPTNDPAEIRLAAEQALIHAFTKALINGGADKIIDSVRPAFEAAAAGISAAAEWITPSTDANQVLERGDDAVNAWREMPKHRQVLDAIDQQIIAELVDAASFNAIPTLPWMGAVGSGVRRALFYVRDETVDVVAAGRFMAKPTDPNTRGGRWLELVTNTEIRLNNLTTARTLAAHHTAEIDDRDAMDFALTHPPLQQI